MNSKRPNYYRGLDTGNFIQDHWSEADRSSWVNEVVENARNGDRDSYADVFVRMMLDEHN